MVVCDLNMPNMNGLEMIRKVRQDSRFDGIPIVMLTTEGQKEKMAEAEQAHPAACARHRGALRGWSVAVAVALIWLAHIGIDRMLGYGLKHARGFGHTHLGPAGRR